MQNRLERGLTGDREASWGTVAVVQVRDDEMGMTIGDRCKSKLGYRISRRSGAKVSTGS